MKLLLEFFIFIGIWIFVTIGEVIIFGLLFVSIISIFCLFKHFNEKLRSAYCENYIEDLESAEITQEFDDF